MIEGSREGMRIAAARGVTALHDKDGWLGSFEVHQQLLADDELLVRVWQSLPWERLDELAALGIRSGFGNDMLRLGYLKGFMDGTLGSATALLLDGSGVEITSRAALEDVVRRAARAGWPVAVHAIGDGANRSALDAFEATRDEWQPRGLRPRIEHAQLLAPEEFERFAEIGVSASVQFSHAPSDRDLADRLWEGRQGAYAYRSLADAGARLANGSDAPVEELDPLAGIVAGVRRTLDERPPWRPEQALTLDEALRATCIAPGLARTPGAPPWDAAAGNARRPRRPRPRPLRVRARAARRAARRGDHGRRALDAPRPGLERRVSATRDAESRAEQLAGGIYGTIVVAGLLASTGPDDDPEVWPTALWVTVTVVVFWLAHSWSLSIARRATGVEEERRGLRQTLAHHWPLVQAAFPPLAVMFIAAALGASDETAITLATVSCVVLLAGWGIIVGRQEHESVARIALTSVGCASLGALMVLLKVVIH